MISCFLILGFATNLNGQLLKKLGKRAERAAERTVERRVERETQKKTDAALDSILEPGSKGNQGKSPNTTGGQEGNDGNSNNGSNTNTPTGKSGPKTIQVYSKFDYVPRRQTIILPTISPMILLGISLLNGILYGSGEVVTINDSPQKWLKFLPGHATFYIPDVPSLPEDYTIEFDLFAVGLDRKTSSTATLQVELSDNNSFSQGNAYARVLIPFCQYSAIGFRVRKL